jgi:hypothetical protein
MLCPEFAIFCVLKDAESKEEEAESGEVTKLEG